ncbi:hypothetical protein GYMLUDRAFT_105653, partial [Collybiopsis luxurians FD-317 M1]
LGEMVVNDDRSKRSPRKYCRHLSAQLLTSSYKFTLNSHKADKFFEGNHVLIDDPQGTSLSCKYLILRDHSFLLNLYLWIQSNGSLHTCTWFLKKLYSHIPDCSFARHSMQAGGATALAED